MNQPNYMHHVNQAFVFGTVLLLARKLKIPSAVPGMLLPLVDKKLRTEISFGDKKIK